VSEQLSLVIASAAGDEIAAANRRFKWRRLPSIERINRLHIVMPVNEDGRTFWRALPACGDERMAFCWNDPHVAKTDAPQVPCEPIRATHDVAFVFRLSADGREADEVHKLPQRLLALSPGVSDGA